MQILDNILGIIMGGGRGSRLYPLTRDRAKPAVPIAGKYRLIDIPISNCINSGIHHIAVLTQFNSVSLHRHITQTYNFDAFHRGWVQLWAAEQTIGSESWYQGTADAVRKQLFEIRSARADYVLILAGDHLYQMDYEDMARFHWDNGADITVAVQPASTEDASRFGILKRSDEGLITDFVEKPKDPKVLKKFISRDDPERPYLASMGNYFFKTDVLLDLLNSTTDDDFGGEVIPKAIHTHKVCGFDFDGYWEDIGTIRSFYEVNLKLASPDSPFNFNDPTKRIYTRARFLPSTKVDGATLEDVMISEGCLIGKAEIENAVIGLRSQIGDGAVIRNTVLMGADYYDNPDDLAKGQGIPLGIGKNSVIDGALIDKNARIGEGVVIKPFPPDVEIDHDDWVVRDGIVVIPKRAVIHPGTVIAPDKAVSDVPSSGVAQ
ncbi:MAG TPA: glucose-1-phosphate adenylyltransferase [Chloroflexi bacterium]|nr:glucose-1-phosphate adenylyltransferase [Chloroflexota bacterium]